MVVNRETWGGSWWFGFGVFQWWLIQQGEWLLQFCLLASLKRKISNMTVSDARSRFFKKNPLQKFSRTTRWLIGLIVKLSVIVCWALQTTRSYDVTKCGMFLLKVTWTAWEFIISSATFAFSVLYVCFFLTVNVPMCKEITYQRTFAFISNDGVLKSFL